MSEITVEEYSILQAQQLPLIMPMYRLTATEYDVWNTLLGYMQHAGQVPLSRTQIAHRLNIDPASVSRALSRLKHLGLIWRIDQGLWQINPVIAFKGSAEEWIEAMKQVPEDVPEVPVPDHEVRPPRRSSGSGKPRIRSIPA